MDAEFLRSYLIYLIGYALGMYFSPMPGCLDQATKLDIRREEYDSVRCANGGSVVETENKFVCECEQGYGGEFCQLTVTSPWSECKVWLKTVIDGVGSTVQNVFAQARRSRTSDKACTWSLCKVWLKTVIDSVESKIQNVFAHTHRSRTVDEPSAWSLCKVWLKTAYDSVESKIQNVFTNAHRSRTFYKFYMNIFDKFNISDHRVEGFEKNMTSTRILPPERPSSYSLNGELPSLSLLHDQIVLRKTDRINFDPKRKNILYGTFYRYFVMQFFGSDFNPTVTASQLYGSDNATLLEIRTFSNGKLKTSNLYDSHFAPHLSSEGCVKVVRKTMKPIPYYSWFDQIIGFFTRTNQKPDWTSMDNMISVMSMLWTREHNRICDLLIREWPNWTDEHMFRTAKRIVIGEMMGIMIKDVIKANADLPFSLKYQPELFNNNYRPFVNSSYTTPLELYLVNMWPSDSTKRQVVGLEFEPFSDIKEATGDGMSDVVEFMISQKTMMITNNNYDKATEPLTKRLMDLSRKLSVQSFNNYRRMMGLDPYKTFYELTESWETADKLKALYESVEDVELLTGMLAEKKVDGVASTTAVMTNSFIINSVMTNPMQDGQTWNADTFGGINGFNVVKSANIETFICNNLAHGCHDLEIGLYAKY